MNKFTEQLNTKNTNNVHVIKTNFKKRQTHDLSLRSPSKRQKMPQANPKQNTKNRVYMYRFTNIVYKGSPEITGLITSG